LDARTGERGPSAEKTRPQERRPDQASAPDEKSWLERLREHWILTAAGTLVLLAALIGSIAYWLQARHYESTDDAFIAARAFSVASKVGGYVRDVPVTDNQHVNPGDLLARTHAQVGVAQANVTNVEAQLASQREQIDQANAQLEQAQAQLKFAQQEAARAQELVERGAGPFSVSNKPAPISVRRKPTLVGRKQSWSPRSSESKRSRRSSRVPTPRCSRRRRSLIKRT